MTRRAAAAGAVAATLVLLGCAGQQAAAPDPADELPPPPEQGLTIPEPELLSGREHETTWAAVLPGAIARVAPDEASPPVSAVSHRTPEGTANIVVVSDRSTDGAGRVWLRAHLASLPPGKTGWIPRRSLGGYGVVSTRLVVSLPHLEAALFRDGKPVFRAPIGVGTAEYPTPRGEFYVRNRLSRYRSPAYGPIAFGTSARSETVIDWPGGGFVGLHGTDRPEILPGRVSHGCIRLRNADILALDRLIPITIA